ncbi:ParB-like nuclease domain [Mycobacteroides abscessus subsp. bolletii]|uniref:ParB N-terminal domain-containing protein n=1 Tax=Mycobacteroides abscessus TaxID=36809 RepID=UPI0009C8BA71|nr:ParB N-terminal domain-containing protein [Mycobacteroides abscessus]SKX81176.1 ParB-like nuclease domain [Mycobacteroides abscessus subsp. bolletii]
MNLWDSDDPITARPVLNAAGLPLLPVTEGDPIDHIRWVPADTLDANTWNPNRVHLAELRLLERSLLSTGWLQPLLVNPERLIIDGFHRWRLSQDSNPVRKRWRGRVPVAVLHVDRPTAMLMTIRINRAKGTHVAVEMSAIVRELIEEHGIDRATIAAEIGGTKDEVDLLAQEGVFAAKNIKNHAYSNAWYPKAEIS